MTGTPQSPCPGELPVPATASSLCLPKCSSTQTQVLVFLLQMIVSFGKDYKEIGDVFLQELMEGSAIHTSTELWYWVWGFTETDVALMKDAPSNTLKRFL